ncbi:MAG: hypothetical protein MR008_00490 [Aerococcus sp.]|nr:hypothetical protein [Aerococcus sp.]
MAKKNPASRETVGRGTHQRNDADMVSAREVRSQNNSMDVNYKRQSNDADMIHPRDIKNQNNSTAKFDDKPQKNDADMVHAREVRNQNNAMAKFDDKPQKNDADMIHPNEVRNQNNAMEKYNQKPQTNKADIIHPNEIKSQSNAIAEAGFNRHVNTADMVNAHEVRSQNNSVTADDRQYVRDLLKADNTITVATEDNIDELGRPKHEGPQQVKRKRSKAAIIFAIIIVIFAGMAIYGVLGMGFLRQANLSLFQGMDQLSQVAEYVESVKSQLGIGVSQSPLIIRVISYTLIAVPILTAFFSIFKSKIMQIIGIIVAFIEAGMFIFAGFYVYQLSATLLGSFQSNFFNAIFQNASNVLGLPAYMLFIGVVGMVIFTIIRFIGLTISTIRRPKRVIR